MKYIRILFLSLFLLPFGAHAAGGQNDFMIAAQLLAAARNADINQVQILVNSGADINYVDATGLSLVCTALMNNDTRAAQILQMYGADASQCDRQIKKYNNRTKPKPSGGLFSGLSSVQSMTLAAAGAAVVVGGLLLLTDVLDPGNDNDNGNLSGGNRPGTDDGNGDDGGDATAGLTVPYSPAYLVDGVVDPTSGVYKNTLDTWVTSSPIHKADFDLFRTDGLLIQNYLLMMHGYAAYANGYTGQAVFRSRADKNAPLEMENAAQGGAPVITSLIVGNGVNPVGSIGRGDVADRDVGILYANGASAKDATGYKDKYLNFANPVDGVLGAEISTGLFDLSGAGTAMNPFAGNDENILAKIIAGWEKGRSATSADFMGFVPYGQLGIFRTGNGQEFVNVENPTAGAVVGTVTNGAGGADKIDAGDTITLDGVTYELSMAYDVAVVNPTITINGKNFFVAPGSNLLLGTCISDTDGACDDVSDIAIYQGTDGYYYLNKSGTNLPDAVWVMQDNNLYVQKELQNADYKNFEAMFYAQLNRPDVIANVSLIDESSNLGYVSVADMPAILAQDGSATSKQRFMNLVDMYYDNVTTGADSQGVFANNLFNGYSDESPFLVMPAGAFKYGVGDGLSMKVLDATFENYAPVLYENNLEHMFMTVVAVKHKNGTSSATDIPSYGNGTGNAFGLLELSQWSQDDVAYMSRKCGVAGMGLNGVDPWCFAAAGATSEMATAAAAGAVASLKSAFSYSMSNPQIYTLLALTADGAYLGTDTNGKRFTSETLANYLQGMYALPPEKTWNTPEEYLKAFADVYGYGLINLERAMTPNKTLYFFDGTQIVSGDKNAYWGAVTNTSVRASSVLSLAGARVSTAVFDVLESVDGSMRLPRVWESEFALGNTTKRGLYMGDVLGEFSTRKVDPTITQFGDMSLSMAVSERAYVDNMGGLDNLSLAYSNDNWNMRASYQHYFTDGKSRFNGMANPILNLASNVVTTGAEYKSGDWSFGGRGYSGLITDESLLENDPTISAQYMPGKLGRVSGAESHIAYGTDKFGFTASVGATRESDTLLGAVTDGLLDLGSGNTVYVDVVSRYDLSDTIGFSARTTFARTTSDATGAMVLGLTDIESNAFTFGANVGNFEFTVAQPLAITDGALQYAHAEYDVVEVEKGKYDLVVRDARVADLSLRPDNREVRFTATYRHSFGEFTDGALGLIYRVNPNHTDDFGNESIFMMKLSHRLGI